MHTTVSQLRDELTDQLMEGVHCPVCDQFAKMYERQIHGSMARTLIRMYRTSTPGDFIYLPDIPQKSRDSTFMALWGLIEELPEKREDGGRKGWWRVTPRGQDFVLKKLLVPKYAYVYDGKLIDLDGPSISIIDALGKRFDYRELMSS